MSTTLAIRFDLGRYHATPWGRNVNEGIVEMPPSPWRLLRALYAVWRNHAPDLPEDDVQALLRKLASEAPEYDVPQFRIAHTRHYYPDHTSRSGGASVDRTLDAFAAIDPDAVLRVRWKLDLPDGERNALERLAKSLPYLGRADSICTAQLLPDTTGSTSPCRGTTDHTSTWRPRCNTELDAESAADLLATDGPLDIPALTTRPVDWRMQGRLYPPGTRQIPYVVEATRPRQAARVVERNAATVVRLVLGHPIRPAYTDTVALTDLLHRAAAHHLNRLRSDTRDRSLLGKTAPRDSNLLGKTAAREPLTGHRHAHYLTLPDSHHRIGEVVVWAPGGLDEDEVQALTRISSIYEPPSAARLPTGIRVMVNAYGGNELLPPAWQGTSRSWRSITPYVPTGHPKGDRDAWIHNRLRRDLEHVQAGLGDLLKTSTIIPAHALSLSGAFEKRRAADRSARAPIPPARFLDLEFLEPVTAPYGGPLCLGQMSHYGLGRFEPAATEPATRYA